MKPQGGKDSCKRLLRAEWVGVSQCFGKGGGNGEGSHSVGARKAKTRPGGGGATATVRRPSGVIRN